MVGKGMVVKAIARKDGVSSGVATEEFSVTGSASVGGAHALGLKSDGQVFAWGAQQYGRLGNGQSAVATVLFPNKVQKEAFGSDPAGPFANAWDIAAGATHSLVLDKNGQVWGFGYNLNGEVGDGTQVDRLLAKPVLKSAGVPLDACSQVAAGETFSLALGANGTVNAWGSALRGRLGNGAITGRSTYAISVTQAGSPFPTLSGIKEIAAGAEHGLAREAHVSEAPGGQGRVWAWGTNSNGQLGLGNITNQSRANVLSLQDIVSISGGEIHSAAVRLTPGDPNHQGEVWCFGSQDKGRLGNGLTAAANISTPVRVKKVDATPADLTDNPLLNGITQVACGAAHTLALDNLGQVWSWGYNASGELGDGGTTQRGLADRVKTPDGSGVLSGIVRIEAGGTGTNGTSMAWASDGTVYCWGRNADGMGGNGTTANVVSLPTPVKRLNVINRAPDISLGLYRPDAAAPSSIQLIASVIDKDGPGDVQKVEFFEGTQLLGTVGSAPWKLAQPAPTAGSHAVHAVATDSSGATHVSPVLNFTIPLDGYARVPSFPDRDQDGIPDDEDDGGEGDWQWAYENDALHDPDGAGIPASTFDSLIGFWDFEMLMASPNRYPNRMSSSYPAVVAGATSEVADGMLSKGLRFGGANDYVDVDPAIVSGKTNFTLSTWVRFAPSSLTTTKAICYFRKNTTTFGFGLSATGSNPPADVRRSIWFLSDKGNLQFQLPETLASQRIDNGKWHQIMVVREASQLKLYVDGKMATGTLTTSLPNAAWTVGTGAQLKFGGSAVDLDRVMFFDRGLNVTEAGQLFNQDEDHDGAPDYFERNVAGDPYIWGQDTDYDHDGLPDALEFINGTDWKNADSDGDGVFDGFEVTYGFNPKSQSSGRWNDDPDGDGINNWMESVLGTDPTKADTDNDGTSDSEELQWRTNPVDPDSVPLDPLELTPAEAVAHPPHCPGLGMLGVFGPAFGPSSPDNELKIKIGDHSSSHSEQWRLLLGEASVHNHSTEVLEEIEYPLDRRNWTEVSLEHMSTTYSDDEGPDYDYTAKIDCDDKSFYLWDGNSLLIEYSGNGHTTENTADGKKAYIVPIEKMSFSTSLNFSGNDATGPRYRKLSLAGRPLGDQKPESEAETDQNEEETYVDAFDLSLRHDNSLIYTPLAASDLVLQANLSANECIWTERSGIRPHESMTQPFGAGWSSNLSSYIEVLESVGDDSPDPVVFNVVDEEGRSQRFTTNGLEFMPWPSSRVDKKTLQNSLSLENGKLVYRKKFGTKLIFEPTSAWFAYSSDRIQPSPTGRRHLYWRLEKIVDRFDNELVYSYGAGDGSALIPTEISCPQRPGQKITIQRSSDCRRVEAVTDSLGNRTTFDYEDVTWSSRSSTEDSSSSVPPTPRVLGEKGKKLVKVHYADGTSADYGYGDPVSEVSVEEVKASAGLSKNYRFDDHIHFHVVSIKDRRGKETKIEYVANDYTKAFSANGTDSGFYTASVSLDGLPSEVLGGLSNHLKTLNKDYETNNQANFKTVAGLPQLVSKVERADGSTALFARPDSKMWFYPKSDGTPTFTAQIHTKVTDAEGNVTRYDFEDVHGEIVELEDEQTYDPGAYSQQARYAPEWMIYYLGFSNIYEAAGGGTIGEESYAFDLDSGLALSSVTDFSSNVTGWAFGDATPYALPTAAGNIPTFGTKWSDPTIKTDALGRTETYEYDESQNPKKSRRLLSTTDVHNIKTETPVDANGNQTALIVTDLGTNQILKKEAYEYTSTFKGFMTRKTVQKFAGQGHISDPSWVQNIVTDYVPDELGRLKSSTMHADGTDLKTEYTYDLNNNKKTIKDPRGNVTTFHYDLLNRLVRTDFPTTFAENGDPLASSSYIQYDKNGRKAATTDEEGNTTIYLRDDLGRVTHTVIDMDRAGIPSAGVQGWIDDTALQAGVAVTAQDLVTRMTYNKVGRVIRQEDARGFSTCTVYDGIYRPIHVFTGVPAGQGDTLGALVSLAAASSEVTHTELGYQNSVTFGGKTYAANPGSSAFDTSGFKPTSSRRVDAVGTAFGSRESLFTYGAYDAVYRSLATGIQYAGSPGSGDDGFKTTETAYGLPGGGAKEALVTSITDDRGTVTKTVADGLGRTVSTTQAQGVSGLARTTYAYYTSTGLAWRTIEPQNRYAETRFDSAGRAVQTWAADPVTGGITANSPTTQTIYDEAGNVLATIDPRLKRTDFEYDARNRQTKALLPAVTNAKNPDAPVGGVRPERLTYYNGVGKVTAARDERGNLTRSFLDRAYRVYATRTNPVTGSPAASFASPGTDDITSSTELDPGGLALSSKDGNGNITRNAYDGLGRLVATATDPAAGSPVQPGGSGFNPATYRSTYPGVLLVSNEYDDAGNLVCVTDGRGCRTGFIYDGLARKTRTLWDPGTVNERAEISAYDGLVQVRRTDGMGRITAYGYDALHRLKEVIYNPGSGGTSTHLDNQLRSYDETDSLLSVTYPNDPGSLRETASTYDKLKRLTSETSAGVKHTYPVYDEAGNRKQTVYGRTNRALVCEFDDLNRLSSCEERDALGTPSGRVTSYAYDLGGKVTRKTLPNGTKSTTSYDYLGRTRTIVERDGANAIVSANDYSISVGMWPTSYDGVGNVLRVAETYTKAGIVNRVVVNGYDKTYRLLAETATPAGGSATATYYGYDAGNNRTSKVAGGVRTGYIFGNGTNGCSSNQLISYGPSGGAATWTFTYDQNGNRATRTGASGTDTYSWDHENRLISVDTPTGDYAYTYDYRSRRVLRDESAAAGVKTALTFSGGTSVQEANASGVVQVELIRGSDWGGGSGGVLYTVRGTDRSYNAYNSRGDVVSTTDGSGAATWQASYEAFGTRTAELGTNVERQRANTKDEDPTGLLNEGFRYRDLDSGTFISRDPAGFVDGPNVYTYVRQNPWSKFDPEGLSERVDKDGFKWQGKGHHKVPVQVASGAGWHADAKKVFDEATIDVPDGTHNGFAHGNNHGYNAEASAEMSEYLEKKGGLAGKSAKEQVEMAEEFVQRIEQTDNKYIQGFNKHVSGGKGALEKWFSKEGKNIVLKATGKVPLMKKAKILTGIAKTAKIGGKVMKGVPIVAGVIVAGSSWASGKSIDDVGIDVVMSGTGADIAQDVVEGLAKPALNAMDDRENRSGELKEFVNEALSN